jgi:hypothetical protein
MTALLASFALEGSRMASFLMALSVDGAQTQSLSTSLATKGCCTAVSLAWGPLTKGRYHDGHGFHRTYARWDRKMDVL